MTANPARPALAPLTVASLFKPRPKSWGLRGDPYLWAEMAKAFKPVALPASQSVLRKQIRGMFRALTGHSLLERESFHIERFAHGGMSSGLVDPQFWREEATALLVDRFELLQLDENR